MNNVNDRIAFRFVTRTQTEDYRVIGLEGDGRVPLVQENDGNRLSDENEFEPLRLMGDIIPEEGPCAVLFEHGKKIYLVVSGMGRGEEDKAGRPKRFSFCQIFHEAERVEAYAVFTRIVSSLSEVESKVSELIKEVPVSRRDWQGRKVSGENIEFLQLDFINWLQEKQPGEASFKRGMAGKMYRVGDMIWPGENCRLKWMREASADSLTCERMEGINSVPVKRSGLKFALITALTFLALILLAVSLKLYKKENSVAAKDTISQNAEKNIASKDESADDGQPDVHVDAPPIDMSSEDIALSALSQDNVSDTVLKREISCDMASDDLNLNGGKAQ